MARILRENDPLWVSPSGQNPGDVWQIATHGTTFGHFAMFPEQLVERPILAGCPQFVCKRCGVPRLTSSVSGHEKAANHKNGDKPRGAGAKRRPLVFGCKCKRGFDPGVVLDPFMGAGTTAVVAKRLGRRFIGFELKPEYVEMASQRLAQAAGESITKNRRHPRRAA